MEFRRENRSIAPGAFRGSSRRGARPILRRLVESGAPGSSGAVSAGGRIEHPGQLRGWTRISAVGGGKCGGAPGAAAERNSRDQGERCKARKTSAGRDYAAGRGAHPCASSGRSSRFGTIGG